MARGSVVVRTPHITNDGCYWAIGAHGIAVQSSKYPLRVVNAPVPTSTVVPLGRTDTEGASPHRHNTESADQISSGCQKMGERTPRMRWGIRPPQALVSDASSVVVTTGQCRLRRGIDHGNRGRRTIGHLERHIAPVAHQLGADLDQLSPQAGQRPRFRRLGASPTSA
jgi:hypothetical protein